MAEIVIRVGAALDRGVGQVFQQVQEMAKRANRAVAAEVEASSTQQKGTYRDNTRMLSEEYKKRAAESKAGAKEGMGAWLSAHKEIQRSEREHTNDSKRQVKERVQAEKEGARDVEREQKRAAKEAVRSAKESAQEIKRIHGERTEAAFGAVRGAAMRRLHTVRDFAAGAGVNFDMNENMRRNTELETRSQQIANEAYQPNDPRNNRRVNAETITKESFEIGTKTGTAVNEVNEAFQEFVGKTGDLATGREGMEEFAQIAKATGTTLKDVASAAAEVNNQLGEMPNKGEAVKQVMLQAAGESKLGAIPMRQAAKQMAAIAANARSVEGNPVENIGLFGAIAQSVRLGGGGRSAAQAGTSVMALQDTFAKGARAKEFAALGISLEGAGGKGRRPDEIIIESLRKTQRGTATESNVALGKLFASSQSRKAVRGFETVYRGTYADTQGTAKEKDAAATLAVRKEFERLQQTMSAGELAESFRRQMNTSASTASVFNNEIQKLTQELQAAFLPALKAIVPDLVLLAKTIGKWFGGSDEDKKHEEVQGQAMDAAASAAETTKILTTKPEKGKVLEISETKQLADLKLEKELTENVAKDKAAAAKKKAEGTGGELKGAMSGGADYLVNKVLHPLAGGNIWGAAKGALSFGSLGESMGEGIGTGKKGEADKLKAQELDIGRNEAALKNIHDANQKVAGAIDGKMMRVIIVKDNTKHGPSAKGPQDKGLEVHE